MVTYPSPGGVENLEKQSSEIEAIDMLSSGKRLLLQVSESQGGKHRCWKQKGLGDTKLISFILLTRK